MEETALGQYTSEGGVTVWRKICPMFQGVGIASQVMVIYLNIYSYVIFAWALFYLLYSFKNPLVWSTCENYWNTVNRFANPRFFNSDSDWSFLNNVTIPDYYDDSEGYRVLKMSDELSKINWELALCLLFAWIICYFCIFKGIKSIGKVVYFTATFPYLLLIILLIRGVTLPGASEGVMYYLKPEFRRLHDLATWTNAAFDILQSYALCQGVLTALGSYNKYNNNCYRDCIALCCLKAATGVFCGFVVFSVLGFAAHSMDYSLHEVVSAGPHLVFEKFPEALAMLPASCFWAVLFFFMVIILNLDTQFVRVESLATAIADMFPHHLRRPHAKMILVLVLVTVFFLLGLPFVSQGGIILFSVVDLYGPSETNFLIVAGLETVAIAWVYGADRFIDNIEDMIGYKPNPVLKYCWLFVTPVLCLFLLLYSVSQSRVIMIMDYVPGIGYKALGSVLFLIPLICIPVFILISLCRNVDNMTRSSKDLRQAQPHKPLLTLCNCVVLGAQRQPNRSLADTNEKLMMEEGSGV
ncbi:sodium- and chloride-dependent betaine transporter-like [Symphorus nematophorus]